MPADIATSRGDKSRQRLGTAATLLAAAESLSAEGAEGLAMLGARAFEYYAEGLRQYLRLRLDPEQTRRALSALRAELLAMDPSESLAPPGVRARLYRRARARATSPTNSPTPKGTLRWRAPTKTVSAMRAIEALRGGELGERTELLELHFARDLSIEEIAFVLETSEQEVQQRLEQATAEARQLLDAGEVDMALPTALLEAFALEAEEAAPAPESAELPEGTLLGDRYRLDRHIGAGAFADVYRATDTEVEGHVVALKLLRRPSRSAATRERALRELHLIASVFHPSIVHFNDNGWYEDRLWFAMPWYEGESLEARLERAPLSRQEAQRIFVPLARALAAMHAAGIRHQDVKPDNIFLARLEGVGRGGEDDVLPVLLDLGVAAKDTELLLAGTPTYFAPEVAAQFAHKESASTIGPRADVYSLALSLRNALEPETAEDVVAGALDRFIEARATEPVAPPTSKELRYLAPHLERWLAAAPHERPTASEFAEQLSVLTAPEERRERRRRILRIVLPLLVALTSVFIVVGYRLSERAKEEQLLAEKAREAAAHAQADLEQESSRRQELEGAVSRARERIQRGQLSAEDLAQQLAKSEGELEISQRRAEQLARRGRGLSRQLTEAQAELEQRGQQLADAQGARQRAEARVQELNAALTQSRGQARQRAEELTRAQADLTAAQQRARQAESAAEEARSRAQALSAELSRTQAELEAARRDQTRLTNQLAQERQRNAELSRQLAQARAAARRPAPTIPSPTPALPSMTTAPLPTGSTPATMRPRVQVRVGN